ncbi:ComF family protein [Pedobacter sp. PWIIR3]
MNTFRRILEDLIGLLYPNLCYGCLKHLYTGESLICTECLYHISYTDHHLDPNNRVAKQFWGRIDFNAAMALLNFKKGARVQNLIHHLKYKNQMLLGERLGTMVAANLINSPYFEGLDLIIPVPMHPRKQHKRGYNQSECIAKGIAAELNIAINTTALLKTRETTTQTRRSRYSRHENMKSVFSLTKPVEIEGKHILLVDDVITTGATIEACAIEISKAKDIKLSIAAVAFAD